MDILTGTGELLTASPHDHSDLYRAFPNSYGTLGYSTRLRIELETIKPFVALRHIRFNSLTDMVAAMDRIIDTWLPLTFAVNSINRSMGQPDLYPFVLPPPVIWKLAFVHERIHAADASQSPDAGRDALRAIIASLKRAVASPQPAG